MTEMSAAKREPNQHLISFMGACSAAGPPALGIGPDGCLAWAVCVSALVPFCAAAPASSVLPDLEKDGAEVDVVGRPLQDGEPCCSPV